MLRKFLQDTSSFLASHLSYTLVFIWLIGAVIGSWLGFQLVPDYRIPLSQISIGHRGVLLQTTLLASSLGIAVLLNHFRFRFGVILLAGIKSVSYSYTVAFILLFFSQAGWLMVLLLMMSDSVFTFSFLYFCFSHTSWSRVILRKRLCLLIFICFLALLVDVIFITPILDTLIYKI